MAFVSGTTGSEAAKAFLLVLQGDFKNLGQETKKKYPQIKESCEEAIMKLKNAAASPQTPVYYVVNQILYPLVQGCESKDVKIIKFCLGIMQRLITQQMVDQKGARYITDTLWMLMEHGTEEVKVLQTVTLLLTTNSIVHGDTLAKALVLCFRLHFAKDSTTINTAGATVRQLVSLVFERVCMEERETQQEVTESETATATGTASASSPIDKRDAVNMEEIKLGNGVPPKGLKPCAADAFLLFQDLVQLVNADQPYWLLGMTEMTRTFGLELLETVLATFTNVFYKNAEFSFLLKERVCALVIKLFSPNIKYRSMLQQQQQQNVQQPVGSSAGSTAGGSLTGGAGVSGNDKPYFPISMRLLRVVSIIIQKYHSLLITECEIFLSLIVKFLDPDKPAWQRSLALEVIHKMTIQPDLLVSFCKFYDLKDHATNIFQDIINSLGAFVQSLFSQSQYVNASGHVTQSQPPALIGGLPVGPGVSPQPGFLFRGIWLPLVTTFPTGQTKPIYLEMLDKMEPPVIPDGYGISIAYACLLDIVRSISLAIQGPSKLGQDAVIAYKDRVTEAEHFLHTQLIQSSWCGLLSALAPLIDAATDESATENVLKAMQNYAALCGQLELHTPRDAFITAICKASLPPHYALSVLNMGYQMIGLKGHSRANSQDLGSQYIAAAVTCNAENEFRQQIVAVGTPLPTSTLPIGIQQGPVMLTAKNLQCMRALLHLAHCHGSILCTSWHIVLATLQHLVWILGLKPSTGGSLQAVPKPTTDSSTAGITTAVMADLPVLSQMLSQLFESSQYLDDVALHHLIDALCKLSQEAMELAYSNREPSLFAVAKLLETGLVNLPRIEVLWRPLTNHLLEVCQHPHIRMREWGVEAITYLVKSALQFKYEKPLKDNVGLQTLLLNPLAELSTVPHGDVRQRQLECVLQVLNGAVEISHGWPFILGIIGAVNDHHGEALIRIAFQCLQLVVTDFLPVMPWRCLPLCVNTAAKFGSQTQELNISLTAVGLMWNISDYFNQNQEKLSQTVIDDKSILPDFPGTLNMPHFDKLWMCLYTRLGDLCVDSRPAVRKSAGQTLFSTISAHGNLLNPPSWQAVLWQVLFPLLDKVRNLSSSASNEKVDTSGNILIHHSRNTAQKQWAETQVLTLSGVSRVFNTKRQILQMLGDFPRAWSLLLEFIENAALSKSNEVSLAALKSFQEILYNKPDDERNNTNTNNGGFLLDYERLAMKSNMNNNNNNNNTVNVNNNNNNNNNCDNDIWDVAWRVWLNIGIESTKPPPPSSSSSSTSASIQTPQISVTSSQINQQQQHQHHHTTTTGQSSQHHNNNNNDYRQAAAIVDKNIDFYIPSQAFLTALVQIFPALFQHIRTRFNHKDLTQLCSVLMNAVAVPVHSDSTPYIMSTISDSLLTPLHDGVLDCMELLQKETITNPAANPLKPMIPEIFHQLLSFSKFACIPPSFERLETRTLKSIRNHQQNHHHHQQNQNQHHQQQNSTVEWVSMNYIPFGEKALTVAIRLYQLTATEPVVIDGHILHEIIKALKLPLALKYKCMSSSTWKLAISGLMSALHIGLPVARANPSAFTDIWQDLSDTIDKFLFPSSICTIEDRGIDEIVLDETIDCQIIELLRDEVLPYSNEISHQFILNVVVILNKGSIHSATGATGTSSSSSSSAAVTTSTTGVSNNNSGVGGNTAIGCAADELKLREQFAKTCFETLLQFSLLDETNNFSTNTQTNDDDHDNQTTVGHQSTTIEGGVAGRLAVTALLHRFQEVLKRFSDDERQSGKCPLPRYRLSEISFVLKAVATLIISMKKAPPAKVGQTAWDQLIHLYPYLVDCTTTQSAEVSRSLREALLQYSDLIYPPSSSSGAVESHPVINIISNGLK